MYSRTNRKNHPGIFVRDYIKDRQLRPPTSKLLIPVMKYDPERPMKALWDSYNRKQQTAEEVVIHPVKDLDIYQMRHCKECHAMDKRCREESERDKFAPELHEFMVDDVMEGLRRIVDKVKSFQKRHQLVSYFLDTYMNKHYGNVYYDRYDLKMVQDDLYKFARVETSGFSTIKCLEMLCTMEQLNGFWWNAGLRCQSVTVPKKKTSKKKRTKDAEDDAAMETRMVLTSMARDSGIFL